MFYIPVFLFLISMAVGLLLLTKFDKLKGVELALAKIGAWFIVGISLVSALSFIIFDLVGEDEHSSQEVTVSSEMLRIPEGKKGDYIEDLMGVETNEEGTPIGYKQEKGFKPGYGPEGE